MKHVRDLLKIVAMFFQVVLQVLQGLDIGVHAFFLRVGHEDDAVGSLEDDLARLVESGLTRDRGELESGGGADVWLRGVGDAG